MEYQPSTPSSRALIPGRDDRLHPGLPGLEILADDRQLLLLRQGHHRRDVDRQVGRAVGVRHVFHQRGVRVNHARRNGRVVRFERPFERVDRLMRARLLHEHFRAAAPHHHHAIEPMLFLEIADVGADLLGEILLVLALLHVRSVEPLHVSLIEHRGPRLDGFELRFDLIEQRRSRARPPCGQPRRSSLRKYPSRRTRRCRGRRAERSR